MSFERSVFINCPFDDNYRKLLQPLLFSIIYLGLEPKIASTISSGNIRIQEIKKLIKDSQYSIHDISRCKPLFPGDMPRFNMPFELGLDIGCQTYGSRKLNEKKCLILETEKYHYQKVLSDVSGQDIKEHDDDQQKLINQVREWFVSVLNKRLPGGEKIFDLYNDFSFDIIQDLDSNGFSQKERDSLSTTEFIMLAKEWILNIDI